MRQVSLAIILAALSLTGCAKTHNLPGGATMTVRGDWTRPLKVYLGPIGSSAALVTQALEWWDGVWKQTPLCRNNPDSYTCRGTLFTFVQTCEDAHICFSGAQGWSKVDPSQCVLGAPQSLDAAIDEIERCLDAH